MTLILSVVNPSYALQVGDRLLTVDENPFDPFANKNILLLGRDGWLSIGYTGPAFLRGVPTDARIADALTDGAAMEGWGMRFGAGVETRDIGSSLMTLTDMLNAFPGFRRGNGEVNAVGWQWGRRRQLRRSVLWTISTRQGEQLELRQHLPRPLADGWNNLWLASAGDDPFTREELADLNAHIAQCGHDFYSAERLLVAAVRRAAARRPTIGPNCTSILIRPGSPRIRFIPQDAHLVVTGQGHVEVGFSPWIIGPGAIAPPAQLVGSFRIHTGGVGVEIEGPPPPPGQPLQGAFAQQLRPPAPGYGPHPHAIPPPWHAAGR
jgi:hypothetical protein